MSLFGDGGSNDTLNEALSEIKKIQVPTADSMKIQLQQLVSQGVMTPEQAQAALVNSNALGDVSDNAGMADEQRAAGELGNVLDAKGSDAQEQADMNSVLSSLRSSEKGTNDSILQDAAQRGSLTGGQTLAAQLAGNQQADTNANSNALNANAAAQQRMLQAMSSLGSLGGNIQGQQAAGATNQANAANAIAQFNAQQQQGTNQFNAGANNTAQAQNLATAQGINTQNVTNANNNAARNSGLIQQNFNDQLAKASAGAGVATSLANNQQNQSNQDAQFVGGLLGTAGTVGGAYFGGPAGAAAGNKAANNIALAAHGAIVPGHAQVAGDSTANDTKLYKLSPGEAVLPRSVVQHPTPEGVMSFLSRMKKPAPKPHPEDISSVIQALGHLRGGNQ